MQMVSIQGSIRFESVAVALTNGKMGPGIRENGMIILSMGSGSMGGLMGGPTAGSGETMLWKALGRTRGRMERSTSVNIRIIKRMAMGFSSFLRGRYTADTGRTEKEMALGPSLWMAQIISSVSGKTANKINGLTNKKLRIYKIAPKISALISVIKRIEQ